LCQDGTLSVSKTDNNLLHSRSKSPSDSHLLSGTVCGYIELGF